MAKRAYGLSWTVWIGAAALAAVEPALAETLTPLPEGNPAAIESTEASLSAAAQEDSAVDSSSGTSSGTSRPAADAVDENREAGGDSATEIPQAQPVAITNIQIEPTADGFSLRLEASGELTEPETSVTGNAAIADLSNAVLQLSDGDEFFVSDPVEGISLIDVSALPDNQVRIAITGINAPPTVTISVGTAGLVVSGAPGDPAAQTPDDDTIQIIVTGENEDDYFVPNASTATRTDTRILDTPQAIQVIPQQVLEDQQILRIDDALRNVSGVAGQLNSFSNNAALTVRGFSTSGFDNGPIFRDGFRITNNLSSQEIANVERIEVIKGPSSVLFGQNDPGGLINLVTERPLPFPRYDVEFQTGSFGLVRPTLDLTGPLTEDGRLAYRLNLAYRHEDSFRSFETDTSRLFFAPVISWDISDRSNLTLVMEYLDEEIPFDAGLPVIGTSVVDVPRDRVQGELDDLIRSESLTLGYDFTHAFSENWTLNHGFRYVTQNYSTLVALPLGFDEATG
ncbi:MAG: TonB-dependent receptor plug domain-containing protein, partial [Cyanobacteria bacterium P01_C01_bin.120]